jgi:phospholipase C
MSLRAFERYRRISNPFASSLRLLAAIVVGTGVLATSNAHASRAITLEGIPRLSHVFTIVLENESFASTWGAGSPARYLNSLRCRGVLLTHYYGAGHASNDNYISMTSGQPPNPDTMSDCENWLSCVETDSSAVYGGGTSIADQLEAAGLSWKAYADGMPAPCTHASSTASSDPYQGDSTQAPGYNYADRHNPFIYYGPIVNNKIRCVAHVVPYSYLAGDFAHGRIPNYVFIIPDTCHDGHDDPCAGSTTGGLATADAWLQKNVPPILSYVMSHNGLLVITFDEGATSDTAGCCGAGPLGTPGFGGDVGLLALSPHVASGAVDVTSYDHPSLLRTVEDAFGISTHLNNAGASSEHAMSDLFSR